MTSADRALSLIDRTEANLKRIEELQSAFVAPVLNEWRYAIRHVVSMSATSSAEADKAIGHLKRAYFDSCDIVIDCQLNVIAAVQEKCVGYRRSVLEVAPDYAKWMDAARRAQNAHRVAQLKHGEEREDAFDSLSGTIGELDAVLSSLSDLSEEIALAVRRAKFKFIIGTAVAIATIVSAGVAVISLFIRCSS